MIIWRGWGILAFIYTLLGALVGTWIGTAIASDTAVFVFVGLGGILGAAGGFAHGWYLNVVAPQKKAEEWEAQERVRLRQVAESGRLVYNNVAPQTAAEADQMIEAIIMQGRAQFKRLGYHSVFWIPMQWFAVVLAVICVMLVVLGIAN